MKIMRVRRLWNGASEVATLYDGDSTVVHDGDDVSLIVQTAIGETTTVILSREEVAQLTE